jgi:hypothetical protein
MGFYFKQSFLFIMILLISCTKSSRTSLYDPYCSGIENIVIYPDIPEIIVTPGDTIDNTLVINNLDSLLSVYLEIHYDPNIISVNSINLNNFENPLFEDPIISDNLIDNQNGILKIGVLGRGEGFTGADTSGSLVQIFFHSIQPFTITSLAVKNVELYTYPLENPPIPDEEIVIYNTILIGG